MATPLRCRGSVHSIGLPSFFHILVTSHDQVAVVPGVPFIALSGPQFSREGVFCQKQNCSFMSWATGWLLISTR
jgi:hypothetical protein